MKNQFLIKYACRWNRLRCFCLITNKNLLSLFVLLYLSLPAYGWNALGHRLVAQIAYDQLDSSTRTYYEYYNNRFAKISHKMSLVDAAVWLDNLRFMNELWLQQYHYINIPYSADKRNLLPANAVNAVSAIKQAMGNLHSLQIKVSDKAFSLRILLHVVGDIHQPLHAISVYSNRFPQGDHGGNLFKLAANPIGKNLHQYWDNGGGLLLRKSYATKKQVELMAKHLEKKWPCEESALTQIKPEDWAKESYQLALTEAYQLAYNEKPNKLYQKQVKKLSEQRIAIAGCRLAAVLKEIPHPKQPTI